MDYVLLAQLLLNGVVIGLIYGLIATGLSLQFGILHIVNFAHGEFVMVSMYALAVLIPLSAGSFPLAIVMLLAAAAIVGWLAAKGFLGAVSRRSTGDSGLGKGVFEKSLLLTLGVSIVLLNGVQYVFTATPKMVATGLGYGAFALGNIRLTYGHAFAAAVAIVTFVVLFWFLMRTNAGRALRAVAQNQEAALMIGLDPVRVAGRAIIVSVMLSAIAGVALVPIYVFQPIIGQALLLKAFAIVIIGGMGSISGAAIAAFGLGLLESIVGGYANIVWQNATAFIAMILILLIKPSGLMPATLRTG